MLTKEQVTEVLKTIKDPEIQCNIVDLGLIYEINITSENLVNIKMTLTSAGCPLAGIITRDVEEKVKAMEGVKDCKIEIVYEPAWTPARMSPEARAQLGFAEQTASDEEKTH